MLRYIHSAKYLFLQQYHGKKANAQVRKKSTDAETAPSHLVQVRTELRQMSTHDIPEWSDRSDRPRRCHRDRGAEEELRGIEEGLRGAVENRGVFLHRDERVAGGKLLHVPAAVAPGRGAVVVALEGPQRSAVVHLAVAEWSRVGCDCGRRDTMVKN